jgi:hypothetical protein
MAIIDVLSDQLKRSMTMFGEHSYKERSDFPAKDPEGNVLAHEHTVPRPSGPSELEPYQQEFVDEEGLREFNSMQHLKGAAVNND